MRDTDAAVRPPSVRSKSADAWFIIASPLISLMNEQRTLSARGSLLEELAHPWGINGSRRRRHLSRDIFRPLNPVK
jgi:hypothetical protein